MGNAQTQVVFDFSGDREVQYIAGLPEVGVVHVQEHEGGDLLTVTVEPDAESIGDLLGSEEGALVLVPTGD